MACVRLQLPRLGRSFDETGVRLTGLLPSSRTSHRYTANLQHPCPSNISSRVPAKTSELNHHHPLVHLPGHHQFHHLIQILQLKLPRVDLVESVAEDGYTDGV